MNSNQMGALDEIKPECLANDKCCAKQTTNQPTNECASAHYDVNTMEYMQINSTAAAPAHAAVKGMEANSLPAPKHKNLDTIIADNSPDHIPAAIG